MLILWKNRGESIFHFLRLKTTFRTKFVPMLLSFKKWKTKFVSKSVFRLSRARKTVGPLINLKYMLILFSKLFSKIEKRKTKIDDWFSFFWRSENEWPFDTRINVPCLIQRDPAFPLFLFKNNSKMAAGSRKNLVRFIDQSYLYFKVICFI